MENSFHLSKASAIPKNAICDPALVRDAGYTCLRVNDSESRQCGFYIDVCNTNDSTKICNARVNNTAATTTLSSEFITISENTIESSFSEGTSSAGVITSHAKTLESTKSSITMGTYSTSYFPVAADPSSNEITEKSIQSSSSFTAKIQSAKRPTASIKSSSPHDFTASVDDQNLTGKNGTKLPDHKRSSSSKLQTTTGTESFTADDPNLNRRNETRIPDYKKSSSSELAMTTGVTKQPNKINTNINENSHITISYNESHPIDYSTKLNNKDSSYAEHFTSHQSYKSSTKNEGVEKTSGDDMGFSTPRKGSIYAII